MAVEREFLLVLKSSGLGDGEPELREKLLKSFLDVLYELRAIPARLVCSGTGIFLTTEGSPVAETLNKFKQEGTEIFSCATCLEHYNRKDKLIFGMPTTMKDTVSAMLRFKKVMAL